MTALIVGTEALAAGLVTRNELRREYRMVYRNVYLPADVELTARIRAEAAYLWAARNATVSGVSAAVVLGNQWVSADRAAELTRGRRQAPPGIVVHSDVLSSDEIVNVDGIDVTSPARTTFDVGRRVQTLRAIELVDVLLRDCCVDDVISIIERRSGARGIRRLSNVLKLADAGAESVQETRLRLCLVGAGLPRPETQIELRGSDRRVVRLDMGWREQRVAAEFDGAQHWGDAVRHRRDIERQEFIAAMGWRLVRVSRDQLVKQPGAVVARVRSALEAHRRKSA